MRTNYVLVDYENVQPSTLAALADDHCKIIVFVGASQAKLPFELVAAMQSLGERAEYVRMAGNGPNALDFHIAYYMGRVAAEDPSASLHVISNDTGFDPLIRHLQSRKIAAGRSTTIGAIAAGESPEARAESFAARLRKPGATRPRTETSLSRAIAACSGNRLDEAEVAAIVAAMRRLGLIRIEEGLVVYTLDSGA